MLRYWRIEVGSPFCWEGKLPVLGGSSQDLDMWLINHRLISPLRIGLDGIPPSKWPNFMANFVLGGKGELAVTGARSAFFMTVPQAAHFGPKHPTLPVCKTSASRGPQQRCCPGFNFLRKIRALQQRFRGFFLPSRSFTNVFFSCALGRYLP